MEKVWDELKKIEAQAEQIRSEAQNDGRRLINLAQEEAEKLIGNSKAYAEEESQHLYDATLEKANRNRDEKIKANKDVMEKLRAQSEERMEQASSAVVKSVLGEIKL